MTVEADIFNRLKTLVSNRVYPDEAPEGVPTPYIIYQQVGGQGVNFMEAASPSKKNGRFQVSVWSTTRAEAASLSRQVEDSLVTSPVLVAKVMGAPVATNDPETKLRGTRQDFSIWF